MSVEPLHTPEEGEADPESAEVRHLHSVEDTAAGVEQSGVTSFDEPVEQGSVTVEEPVEEPVAQVVEATPDGGELDESRGRLAALAAWARVAFTPASGLYTERQPTIAETVRRARDGDQLPD